jgi:imidazoleglycerol phosphate dehydratase HisB
MSTRQATISRKTSETQVDVSINLDCAQGSNTPQAIDVSTGIGFLDHVRGDNIIALDRSELTNGHGLNKIYADVHGSS